jgi:hypothetical protein
VVLSPPILVLPGLAGLGWRVGRGCKEVRRPMTSTLRNCLAVALIVSACSATPGNSGGDEGGSEAGGTDGEGGTGGKKPGGAGGSGRGGSGAGGSPSTGGKPGGTGGDESGGGTGAGGSGDGGSNGDGGSGPGSGGSPGNGGTSGSPDTAVLTSRYDNIRTGSTLVEKTLTPANVTAAKFGFLFFKMYKGVVYGQPLFVPGVTINGAKHNVVYVATEANIVYAFDADDSGAGALWQTMLEAPFPLTGGYPSCADMKASGQAGITSTPVIDLSQNKIFLMVKSSGAHRLHALDLATGKDSGTTGMVMAPMFNSNQHINRPGLLLMNGIIYAGFGSHCDDKPYKGWIFAFDAKTMEAKGAYSVTPDANPGQGAIWQSGMGLYGDSAGVVACTGNGAIGGRNLSESVVRVKQTGDTLTLAEHYTPDNAAALNSADNDLTAGVTGIPGTNLIISGGKEGPIYVLDPSLAIKQTVKPAASTARDGLHSLAAWNGSAGPMVYAWPAGGRLYAYGVANGMLTLKSTGGMMVGHPGGVATVSSNGTMPNTGIVWVNIPRLGDSWHATAQGSLFAFDATDVSKMLWNSDADPKDTLGTYAKFSPPLVVNGKVYQATFSGKLMVYGLK